jgi:hypothetical protein
MRQQIGLVAIRSENPFAQTTVPIRPGDEEVCPFVLCKLNELRRTRSLLLKYDPGPTANPVPRQILRRRTWWFPSARKIS